MIVLGIDPGTASTGYGVVQGDGLGPVSLVECGVIRTRPRDPLASRLNEIFEGVSELLERHRPDALSVEDVFYAKNVRTTVVLGHARVRHDAVRTAARRTRRSNYSRNYSRPILAVV